jgi:hypothetical protein
VSFHEDSLLKPRKGFLSDEGWPAGAADPSGRGLLYDRPMSLSNTQAWAFVERGGGTTHMVSQALCIVPSHLQGGLALRVWKCRGLLSGHWLPLSRQLLLGLTYI